MARHPRVDTLPSEQDILNRSFDPVGETLLFQLVGTPDGINYYPVPVAADGTLKTTAGTGGSGGTYTAPNAINNFGSTTALANAATGTLVNIPSSAAGFKLMGFTATGTGDGYFFVQVASVTVFSGRIHVGQKSIEVQLPNPQLVTTASNVTLKVTNESGSTADFEATLLGQ